MSLFINTCIYFFFVSGQNMLISEEDFFKGFKKHFYKWNLRVSMTYFTWIFRRHFYLSDELSLRLKISEYHFETIHFFMEHLYTF